jgi:hypothetical protein
MRQMPGILPGLKLSDFGLQESVIVNNLGASWFVSHASVIRLGRNNRYPFVLLRPTEKYIERFNFHSQILCIFHNYSEVDGRLMMAVDKAISGFEHGVDRLCVLLVTNADSISNSLKHLDTDSESRIIVPFKYNELVGGVLGKEALMISRLEQTLYTKDLFAISSVLKTERYFYGRKLELQRLIGHYSNCENGSVFGLRRIGKSSLLWAAVRQVKQQNAPVAFLDCSDPGFHKARWNKALYRVKETLFRTNSLDKQGNQENDYTEENATNCFLSDLTLIRGKFGKPILLIFDEVENLCFDVSPSEHWRSGEDFLSFWQAIRATFQQSTNLFSFLICGTNPHALEVARLPNGADNPIYKYVEPHYLGFFDVENVQLMVENLGSYMGITFDREIFTYLTDDFGGHPFLIKQACSFLRNKLTIPKIPRKIHVLKDDYRIARDEIKAHTRNYIELILSILTERYPAEFELLRLLAARNDEIFKKVAEDDPQSIEHLIGYGLLMRASNRFSFRIKLVEAAVQHDARDLSCPESLEERWALLSKERNQFEYALRELVRRSIKVGLGAKEGKVFIISCMTKKSQMEKAQEQDYDNIYKGEIYFTDLKSAVLKEWQRFKFVFNEDKSKFSESLDAANKYRSDAHAGTITTDQFKNVMPKLVWLTMCLQENG